MLPANFNKVSIFINENNQRLITLHWTI
jgi:hypothetical protein